MYVLDLLQSCEDSYCVCDIEASHGRDGALIQTMHSGDVVLAFRGTLSTQTPASLLDWINDLHANLVTADGMSGRVHAGFLGSLNALWPGIIEQLECPALTVGDADPLPWNKRLWITGHSKGGALAQLAGYRLAALKPTVITFAAPMVGDLDWVIHYPDDVDLTRYEGARDVVPHLPPMFYEPVGFCVHETLGSQRYLRSKYHLSLGAKFAWEQLVEGHQLSAYRAWLTGSAAPPGEA